MNSGGRESTGGSMSLDRSNILIDDIYKAFIRLTSVNLTL